jgi:hypothetical protein
MSTPIDNVIVAKRILEQDRSPATIDQGLDLSTKAVQQQNSATSSQRLASNPVPCRSSAGDHYRGRSPSPIIYGGPRDDQYRTGSTKRQRQEARYRSNAIPVSSDTSKDRGKRPKPIAAPPHNTHRQDKPEPRRSSQRQEAPPRHRADMPPPIYYSPPGQNSHPG